MKYFSLFLFFYFPHLFCFAQQFSLDHTLFIGGVGPNAGLVALTDIVYDKRDKSFIFIGENYNNCASGDIPPCPPVSDKHDILVGKVDSNRNLVWLKLYATSFQDQSKKILSTATGYVVMGQAGNIDGDGSNNVFQYSAWLLNLDFQGNINWSKGYGCPTGVAPIYGGMQTQDGGYVFCGYSNGSGGDIPFQYVNSPFRFDGFVMKTDSLGNLQWSRTLGGTEDDNLINVFEINGEYYVLGYGGSHDHDLTDTSWHPGVSTGWDFFLIKLDSSGNYLWNRTYGGTGGERMGDALFDERDSTIVISGHTTSTDYMFSYSGGQRYNPCFVKVGLDGSLKIAKTYEDTLLSVVQFPHIRKIGPDKGYAISYSEWTSFQGHPLPPPPHYGLEDVHLAILDSSGTMLADKIIGDSLSDYGAILLPYDKGMVAAGITGSPQFREGTTGPPRSSEHIFLSYLTYFPLSVTDPKKPQEALDILPNPANNTVTIRLPASHDKGVLQIHDMGGKKQWSQAESKQAENIILSVRNWQKGIYFVEWTEQRQVVTGKLQVVED